MPYRPHRALPAIIGLLLTHSDPSWALDDAPCLPDQTPKSALTTDKSNRLQWCLDPQGRKQGSLQSIHLQSGRVVYDSPYVDGKRHGITRLYDLDGDAEEEVTHDNGVEVDRRPTRAKLAKLLEKTNENAAKKGQRVRQSIVGDRKYLIEIVVDAEYVATPEAWLAVDSRTRFSKLVCSMLVIPNAHFEGAELHLLSPESAILVAHTFKLEDCVPPTRTGP